MYKYYHRPCLIQLNCNEITFLVDVQKLNLTEEIFEILINDNITKVFQDMKYDFSLLWDQWGCIPVNVFDITVVDNLIRQNLENRSLDKIVYDYLGKKINIRKSMQKSNWGKRPLTENQIEYANTDVEFLIGVKDKQVAILIKDYRLACFKKFMRYQRPMTLERKFNINSIWKIKGVKTLDQAELNRLRRLLLERDKIAKSLNKPPHWISNDSVLKKCAKNNPSSIAEFSDIFLEDKKAKNYHLKIIRTLFSTLKDVENDIYLEEPPLGVPLKRWIPVEPLKSDYIAIPGVAKKIKQWKLDCSKSTKLLPDFLIDNTILGQLASQSIQEMEKQIEFPGVIDVFHDHFLRDLLDFLKTEESNLSSSILLRIFNKGIKYNHNKEID